MTGGQASLSLEGDGEHVRTNTLKVVPVDREGLTLVVPGASGEELAAHREMLESLAEQRGAPVLWHAGPSEEAL